jgi:translation elongation factor aEF-1 beta
MGTALVIIKIMPKSPKSDLEKIQEQAKQIVEKNGGKKSMTKTEPVAFGLNAIILNFAIDESLSIDNIENPLKKIKEVSSAEVIDFRRAFGCLVYE